VSAADLFFRFGIALGIGFLIGLQREFSFRGSQATAFAGVRTFTLLSLGGCTAALVADTAGSAVLAVFLGAVGALVIASYLRTSRQGDVGSTTEVAALLTALNGALCYWGMLQLAAAIGVATTVVLSAKLPLQKLVARLTMEDLVATLKFAVVTAIVLPVLPREPLGEPPFDVLVPYDLWLMVVLISGLGFIGYVLIQIVGPRRGIGLTGVLGGLVSSTALTLSFAQKSREDEDLAKPFALAIVVAWTMMFARMLAAVAVVNRDLLGALWLPLSAAGAAGALYAAWLHFSERASPETQMTFSNPFELGPSLRFGLLYAVVLLISRTAQMELGDRGVILSALAAGIADVDAITLSLSELSRSGQRLSLEAAALGVTIAAMANTALKGGIVLVTGSSSLRRRIWPGVVAILATGLTLALWWSNS
jgi:uncharacterized membrane protein (DUF4010 family)